MDASIFEHLGLFYMGLRADAPTQPYVVNAKDLTTHAVIVGMTGSGKTGLGAILLEEAAIDGIPSIVIDPKGDLGNLLLTFPNLDANDFAPWAPAGDDPAVLAQRHRDGLAASGQKPERIARFSSAVERTIYTPGISAGRRLALLSSFKAPGADGQGQDVDDARRTRAVSLTSSLLSLAGIDGDPLASPEHLLVSSLLMHAWQEGNDVDIASLLGLIQHPPMQRLGLLDTESVIPAAKRQALVLRINNAFASPTMQGFLDGEPLDIDSLLYTSEGKPRTAIINIAALDDKSRMFFVTVLLSELLAWTRRQAGTQSLRALLYMDEVAGYLPPVANPPSKAPMLTLLKQARAFGVGCVLATQNPVDVDYKALANAGVWFLGRLQTERDKARVIEGLEGNAAATGAAFDKSAVDNALSSLPKRGFYAHNVHAHDGPITFTTRYALSYLRGPLTPAELQRLNSTPAAPSTTPATLAVSSTASSTSSSTAAPTPPAGISVGYVEGEEALAPHVWVKATLHYTHAKSGVDLWRTQHFAVPFNDTAPDFEAMRLLESPPMSDAPMNARYTSLPPSAQRDKSYGDWGKSGATAIVRAQALVLLTSPATGIVQKPDEAKQAFISRAALAARDARDVEVERVRQKLKPKLDRAHKALASAIEKRDAREQKQSSARLNVAVNTGVSVLGALFGSRASLTRAAGSAVKGASKASQAGDDLAKAKLAVDNAEQELRDLEAEAEQALEAVRQQAQAKAVNVEELRITLKKADVTVDATGLLWM